jgi:hypothetical protein
MRPDSIMIPGPRCNTHLVMLEQSRHGVDTENGPV